VGIELASTAGMRLLTNRSCAAVATWLCATGCGPAQPTPPDPWSAPVRVADVTDRSGMRFGYSELSCLSVGGNGSAVVLWSERRPDGDALWAQAFSAAGAPGPRETVQGNGRLPQVAEVLCGLDDAGHGYASWAEHSQDQSRLLARRFRPQGWEPAPFLIDERPYTPALGVSGRLRHDLVVEAGGQALIAWIGEAGIRSGFGNEGVWTDAGLIEPRPFSSSTEVTVQARGDRAMAVYARDYVYPEGARGMASYARFLDPPGWGPAHRLGAAQGTGVARPALDTQGRSTVVTTQTFFPVAFSCVSRYQDSAWSETSCHELRVASAPAGAANGEVFLLILEGVEAEVKAARWLPGAAQPSIESVGAGAERQREFTAVLSADGTSHAAWIVDTRPWVSRAWLRGPWRAEPVPGARAAPPSPLPCSRDLFNGTTELRLAADARGNEVITWIEGDCGTATLWLQRRANDAR
jgi:hypothetical protein